MKFALALAFAALLGGCATTNVDYNRSSSLLSLGMSKNEVKEILGNPRRTDVNADRERWIYWNKVFIGLTPIDNESLAQDRLVVTFTDGQVSRWGNQSIADDMIEANQKIIESSHKSLREMQKTAPYYPASN